MNAECKGGLVARDRGAIPSIPGGAADGAAGYAQVKPVVDVALAAVLSLVSLPVVLLVMVLVKLTSRGPAIYSQTRVGMGGRPFVIYKIRTMSHDCERLTGPRWSVGKDPRVTAVGRVLRRLHLDELPQLWNVMRGEMSLVGPRPERPEFVAQLERVIPVYRDRLAIRPGVTGLAQIQLPADEDVAGVRRKVAYDLAYIRQAGPWLDLRILAGTLLKVAHFPPAWTRSLMCLPSGECDTPRDREAAILGRKNGVGADPIAW
jgi:lipopolysaccharide/colanic/teichoic acid biosynthesis glycosyltransferase